MKSLFHGLIGIKVFAVIIAAVMLLIGLSAFLVDHLVQLQKEHEIQRGVAKVEVAIYDNLLGLQSDILAHSGGLSSPAEFKKIAQGIAMNSGFIVALELRSRSGALVNSYQTASTESSPYKVRSSLSPWLIHQFSEAADSNKALYSSPYSADLLLAFDGAGPSNHFFIQEFIPLASIDAVLVVILDCSNWLSENNIEKVIEELPSQAFQIQTSNNITISSSHHSPPSQIISEKVILPINLPGLSLQLVGERYKEDTHIINPMIFTVVSFCLIIAFLLALFLRSFQLQKNTERELRDYHDIILDQSRLATVGEISSVLSHEINQPIATIEAYATAVKNLLESSENIDRELVMGAIDKLKAQAKRAATVVQGIQKLFSTRSSHEEVLSVNDVLKNLESIIAMQAERYRARYIIKITDKPCVSVNRLLFEQVILNLARNAFQSMAQVQSKIMPLLVIEVLEKDGRCEINFIDNGSGVSDEIAKNLFKPFYSTKSDGMGLGLSLSRTLVERFGGNLRWENLPTNGARFVINLPLHSA